MTGMSLKTFIMTNLNATRMPIMHMNKTMMRMKNLFKVLPDSSRKISNSVLNPSKTIEAARHEGKVEALQAGSGV